MAVTASDLTNWILWATPAFSINGTPISYASLSWSIATIYINSQTKIKLINFDLNKLNFTFNYTCSVWLILMSPPTHLPVVGESKSSRQKGVASENSNFYCFLRIHHFQYHWKKLAFIGRHIHHTPEKWKQ